MSHRAVITLAVVFLALARPAAAEPGTSARPLSLSERVEARRAIEGVLWAHRLWPKENHSPKPALDEWLPAGALEREIEEDLRKSDALATRWGRPITHDALQAELNRMVGNSQAPDVLREILAALHGDAFLAAEVLARHSLADRLVRSAYAYDGRVHQDLYRRAEAARKSVSDITGLRTAGDRFTETRYELTSGDGGALPDDGKIFVHRLEENDWRARLMELSAATGARAHSPEEALRLLPIGIPGKLEEGEREFTVTAITALGKDRVTVATAVWQKTPFESWWQDARAAFESVVTPPSGDYVLAALAAPGNPCTNDTWYPLKRRVPQARSEAAFVWTGSEMIVWGGYSGTGALGDGGRYRPDTDTWIETSSAGAPSARRRAAAVWTGTELIVWGGEDGAPTPTAFNDGGRYDPALDRWTATGPFAPTARSYATAVWTGSLVIVWGGIDQSGVTPQTGGLYDPALNAWTATSTTNAPSGRIGHTAVWSGGDMIVWGGLTNSFYTQTGKRYAPATDTWTTMTVTTGTPAGRAWHTAVMFAGRMLVWGGQVNSFACAGDGAFYEPGSSAWTPLSSAGAPPGARMHHSAVVVADFPGGNKRMVIFGGLNFISGFPSEIFGGGTYRQIQNDWRPLTLAGAPSPRGNHAAVGTGANMIVWGGNAGGATFGDGRLYDPFAETWSGISSSGTPGPLPSPRYRHTAVWTGSEMWIWGGLDNLGFASGNFSYSPAFDQWSALSEFRAPTLRYWHTAIWTGASMIVWGGTTDVGVVNTGARFNGLAWELVATPDAAQVSPRRRHTAVWTGTQMIVWGGESGVPNDVLNSGGIWGPATNSWASTPGVSLGGRADHTATWTGDRMIVFGGATASTIWNNGARFDPVSLRWFGLPTSTARTRHSAVWTGDELIVWGGDGGGFVLSDGARYSPSQGAWHSLSPSGPVGRDVHQATWTGKEMIVWGGRSFSPLGDVARADGARYNPGFDGWTPMTLVGAPAARSYHTSVQANAEMLAWGGLDSASAPIDSGGRYCASCAALTGFEAAKDLVFTNQTTLAWTGTAGVTFYNVYRGTLNGFFNHTCLQTNLTSPTAVDPIVPPVDTGYYYLASASNECSYTGLGFRSDGLPRPYISLCP